MITRWNVEVLWKCYYEDGGFNIRSPLMFCEPTNFGTYSHLKTPKSLNWVNLHCPVEAFDTCEMDVQNCQ
jgi:hypothetical protein